MSWRRIEIMLALVLGALSFSSTAYAQNALIPTIVAGPPVPFNSPMGAIGMLGASAYNTRIGTVSVPVTGPLGPLGPQTGVAITPELLATPGLLAPIVPTDRLVRETQIGYTPVGALTGLDLSRGVGFVAVPGAGERMVRVTGPVVQTEAGPAVRAIDEATGIQFVAVVPPTSLDVLNPGPLVSAKVTRVTPDAAFLERTVNGKQLIEVLPVQNVFVRLQGRLVRAAAVRRLRPGAEVLIPARGGPRGTIVFNRPSQFGTRASSSVARAQQ